MTPLANAINGVLAIDPSANAIEFKGSWYSWGDLSASKAAVLEALEGAGLGPETRVGIMMRNRVDLVGAILAVGVSDRCLVTINPTYPDARLADDLRNVRPPVVIGCAEDWQRPALLDAAREIGALCLEVSPAPGGAVRTLAAFDAERADESRRTAPGIALEMLTSGTTGTPKRIPFQATNFSQAVLGAAVFEKGRSEDSKPVLRKGVQILSAPFAHIGGLLGLFNVIVSGRCACLLERFKVDTFHDAIKRHRPKVAGSPPAALKMLLDANVPPEDLSSLVAFRTGTAPLDPDLADRFEETYGIPVLQNYGATEFGGVAGWTLQDHQRYRKEKRGAVGRLNPGVEGRVVDRESGEILAPGEEGVLELKARQIADGQSWQRTTDLAIVDEDRFLWIKGRADATIVRGGFKIQPDDVARAIEAHEAIREAAVTGLPDERLGHVPVAAYVLAAGHEDPVRDDLIAFLREGLLPYQIPTQLVRVDELPRTDSMKVSGPRLRELFADPSQATQPKRAPS
jgi:long-chain acyl-CoA synthetase